MIFIGYYRGLYGLLQCLKGLLCMFMSMWGFLVFRSEKQVLGGASVPS